MITNLLYNTNPIIFHAQGKPEFCPLWDDVRFFCERTKKKIPQELQIVTFNNGNSFHRKSTGSLEKSIQGQCSVLGKTINEWKNSIKIELLVNFLESTESKKSKYILSLDSSDVSIHSIENILCVFASKKCRLLYNAEIKRWPSHCFCVEEELFLKPFCHLNAGAFIGERNFILEFYRECLSLVKPETKSEQECVKKIYMKRYPDIIIDDRCEIFQTLNGVDEKMLKLPSKRFF